MYMRKKSRYIIKHYSESLYKPATPHPKKKIVTMEVEKFVYKCEIVS